MNSPEAEVRGAVSSVRAHTARRFLIAAGACALVTMILLNFPELERFLVTQFAALQPGLIATSQRIKFGMYLSVLVAILSYCLYSRIHVLLYVLNMHAERGASCVGDIEGLRAESPMCESSMQAVNTYEFRRRVGITAITFVTAAYVALQFVSDFHAHNALGVLSLGVLVCLGMGFMSGVLTVTACEVVAFQLLPGYARSRIAPSFWQSHQAFQSMAEAVGRGESEHNQGGTRT